MTRARAAGSDLSGTRILVTGGTGFIGESLVNALLERGARVTIVHRGKRPLLPQVDGIAVSAFTPERLTNVLSGFVCDGVFNLAAYGVAPVDRGAREMQTVNTECALALYQIAGAAGARFFVQAGTSAEYAPSSALAPLQENDRVETVKLYGASKAEATARLLAATNANCVPLAVARIFGVYGPGEGPHRLSAMLWAKLSGGVRVPLSAGNQIRDFLHVDDVVDGLLAVAHSVQQSSSGVVVNLCSGEGVSVKSFACKFAHAMGADQALLGFGDLPLRPDDVAYLVGNPGRLFSLTGWLPHITLEAGLRATIDCLKNVSLRVR